MSFVGLLLYGCKWNLHLTINAQTVVGGVVARRVFWSRKILESCHSGCVWCHILTFDQVCGSTTNTSSLNRSCINKEVPAKFALSRRIYFFYFPVAFIQNSDRKSCAAVLLYICRCIRELPQKIVVEGQYTRAPLADGVRCWKFIDPTTKLSELFNQPLRDSWFQTVGLTDVILWYCSLLRMQMLYLGAESSARSGVVWVQCTPWPKSLQITDNQPFFG